MVSLASGGLNLLHMACSGPHAGKPNIIIIYADDLGYGDLGCYGATRVETPNIDRIAKEGIRFTDAYATAATCTPSRYSLLTGQYAWRRQGTGIAPGDASLIIPTNIKTLPSMLGDAGYASGAVGKWHLGLGKAKPDWNGDVKPGPLETGFDYCFLIPATGDRVPCVFVENHRVLGLDPEDPIEVSFGEKIGDDPTGISNPELLKMKADRQHSDTIVNGISRIGFMKGGHNARWVDEDIADVLTGKALDFIEQNRHRPFFLYFSLHDIHVPRVPNPRFRGKTGMGPRGDAIVQADWCVGEILKKLDDSGLTENTLIIFSSDNGPVLNDGYEDDAVEKTGTHNMTGSLRGGKYSSFEAGTRIPFLIRWPGKIRPGKNDALISQIDLFASFARLTHQSLGKNDAPDSMDNLSALLGKDRYGRHHVVQEAMGGPLSVRMKEWKYIEPKEGPKLMADKNIETGRDKKAQLYHVIRDPGERNNVAEKYPEMTSQMETLLNRIRDKNDRSISR
ncbi:arylsulfatase [bacterium]|nr:arylsulfatase [bacterium]